MASEPLRADEADSTDALVDGRARRAERTRLAVVEAFLDLVAEGEEQPTAQQVSDRSGVSMRSIFRIFQDVDALHAAGLAVRAERVAPLLRPITGSGPFEERVADLVDSRAELFEAISPVRRLGVRLARRSGAVRAELALSDEFLRAQLVEAFSNELDAMKAGNRRETLEMLDVATSWETWERLRTTQQLGEREARRLLAAMVRSTFARGT